MLGRKYFRYVCNKEKFLTSFEKDYWAIDVSRTSREVRKIVFHANLASLRHEFPGSPENEIIANIRWEREYLVLWSCVESSCD